MNKAELLEKKYGPTKSNLTLPVGGRALVACAACPMARFCATKGTGECPTSLPTVAENMYDGGGEMSAPVDYRRDLFDDSKNLVLAKSLEIPKPKSLPKIEKPKLERPKTPKKVGKSAVEIFFEELSRAFSSKNT